MKFGSTDYLKLLATEPAYILLERSVPRGRLKGDFISVKRPSGEDIVMSPAILNDFIRENLVAQDHAEDRQGRAVLAYGGWIQARAGRARRLARQPPGDASAFVHRPARSHFLSLDVEISTQALGEEANVGMLPCPHANTSTVRRCGCAGASRIAD